MIQDNKKQALLTLPLLALMCLAAWFYANYNYSISEQKLLVEQRELTTNRVAELSGNLRSNLFFLRGIPEAYSHLVRTQAAVKGFDTNSIPSTLDYETRKTKWTNNDQLNDLSKFFSITQKSLNVDILFLVNSSGDCIVASNWDKAGTSIGTNFADREWFKSNKATKVGMQYAVGKTTHIPGLYFSSPIQIDGQFMGAVVAKVDTTKLSDVIMHTDAFVADRNGVIILAHDKNFEMKSMPESLISVMSTQQKVALYRKEDIQPLPIKSLGRIDVPELFTLTGTQLPHMVAHRQLDEFGMTAYIMNDLPELKALERERTLIFYLTAILGGSLILLTTGAFCYVQNTRKTKKELEYRQTLLNEAQHLGKLGSWELNSADGKMRWSNEIYSMFELDPAKISPTHENFLNIIHPEDRDKVNYAYSQSIEDRQPYDVNYRLLFEDGRIKWVHEYCNSGFDQSGKLLRSVGVVKDITERKSFIDALQNSERLAKQSLEELKRQKFALDKHSIVAVTDVQGYITYANSKFCEISGYSLEDLIGQDHAILNSGYHPKGFFKEMYRTVASGNIWHDEVCNRAKDGHLYWVDTTISPFMDDNGKPQSYISIRTDITQRVMAEERSSHLALYDALTELPNRRLLQDRLNQALAASARSGQRGALLFLDLDHFKTLNDTLGHDIGDLLLQQVAERLTSCVREGDTVARLGGDEFVVLLEDLSEDALGAAAHTEAIGEKILATFNQPYQLDVHEYHSTASIGATVFDDHQFGIEELLKQADIAMYAAKKTGRNVLRFFDPKMQQAITSRVDLEHELRKALELQEFQLYYQIQVDSTGHPLGAEALIRWSHPERGIISPFHFIPMAEETGLILPIGQWVLDTACAQLKAWQQDPIAHELILAVNVSAKQFLQADFIDQVKLTVKHYSVDPTLLKLELTESLLVDNLNEIIATMTALGELGIKFSLDDFGTGYSSLQYLKTLPLNQLKIDQSFVRDIATDSSDKAIVLTIITMAHSLGLDVIAEGVETEDQRQFLMDNGCLHYQGYLFSKPVSIDEFDALLMSRYQVIHRDVIHIRKNPQLRGS
jgi:diguanylate cyclase (GGDEF)-like protein/PAS domain S-box-containing protein